MTAMQRRKRARYSSRMRRSRSSLMRSSRSSSSRRSSAACAASRRRDRLVGAPLALALDAQQPQQRRRASAPGRRASRRSRRRSRRSAARAARRSRPVQRQRRGQRDRAAHPRPADDEPLAPVLAGVGAPPAGRRAPAAARRRLHARRTPITTALTIATSTSSAAVSPVSRTLSRTPSNCRPEQHEQRRVEAEHEHLPERDARSGACRRRTSRASASRTRCRSTTVASTPETPACSAPM